MIRIGTFPIEGGIELSDSEVGFFIRRGVKSWNKLAQFSFGELSQNLDMPLLVRVREGLRSRGFPVWDEDSWELLDEYIMVRLRENNVNNVLELAHLSSSEIAPIFRGRDTRRKLEDCLLLSDLFHRPDIPELPEKLIPVSRLANHSPKDIAHHLSTTPSMAGRLRGQYNAFQRELADQHAALKAWHTAVRSYQDRNLEKSGG